jgi:hypothetical protein
MNPELMELLLRMSIQDPFANQQILGRDPRQFQQSTEQLGQHLQARGEQPVQNPTFDLMSQLVLEAMAQGMMAPTQPAPASPQTSFFGRLMERFRPQAPDRSQTGSLMDILIDMAQPTRVNPNADEVEDAIRQRRNR